MILGLLALCIVVMLAFPETSTARWLKNALVERPLEWLSKVKRRDVIFLFVMVALLLSAGEFIAVFGPGELIVVGANLSLFLDAVVVTTAVTIATAAAAAWRDVRTWLATSWTSAMRRRVRSTRQGKIRRTRRPKSLDDDAPGWNLACAA